MQAGAGHAFDNHEAEMFWNEAAAAAAWERTVAFLQQHLPRQLNSDWRAGRGAGRAVRSRWT